jgi:ubiquinone/menaquinone biosynthesis C-methylase UbiE
MGIWGRLFAAGYDPMLSRAERAGLGDRRRGLLEHTSGSVIEIGAGTGLNLALYPEAVDRLVLTEPEEPMIKRLERKVRAANRPAEVVRARAEHLPFDDETFDFAVCTLVLCTVPDPGAALAELRRVLKPGGRLLFLEHVRSDVVGVARWQDIIRPVWLRIGCGCNCNRDTLHTIRETGFDIGSVEHGAMPKSPAFVRPLIVGSAGR